MDHGTESIVYHGSFNSIEESASSAVVHGVAAVTNQDPCAMEPLYRVINPDALDTIYGSCGPTFRPKDVTTEFSYHGYTVRISGGGEFSIVQNEVNKPT